MQGRERCGRERGLQEREVFRRKVDIKREGIHAGMANDGDGFERERTV